MNFTSRSTLAAFDFTKYTLDEIRGALKLVCDYSPSGAMVLSPKARDLADILRTRGLGPQALLYMQTAGHLSTRVVSPFNLQSLLSEQFSDYQCNDKFMAANGLQLPITAGFVNYKAKYAEVQATLPGVKVIPFDAVLALNVGVVAGMTRYSADKSGGKVIPVTPPTNLYTGAPYDGSALCLAFNADFAGITPMAGLDWAHFLYQYFFPTKDQFLATIATYIIFPEPVLNTSKTAWTKTFKPEIWPVFKPRDDVQRIECLAKMQAYRSKDNAGISALTYGVYGEEFGSSYRLCEKMTNFEIFVSHLGDELKIYPIRYISNDEKELVCAHIIMRRYGFTPRHYYPRVLDGIEPALRGEYVYNKTIIYHPKCCTTPFTGKMTKEAVAAYAAQNVIHADDRIAKFSGAVQVGFRAHVLGLEGHVLGMATPHNAVAVMVIDCGQYSQAKIWNTIMVAGHARNTYLFHRKPLTHMMDLMVQSNAARQFPFEMIQWQPLRRPSWHPFTKEQRKRIITTLNEFERFGIVPDNISDQDLVIVTNKAQEDPDYLVHLGTMKEAQREKDEIRVQVASLKSPVPAKPTKMDGDNLEDEAPPPEVVRPKLSRTGEVSSALRAQASIPVTVRVTVPASTENFYGDPSTNVYNSDEDNDDPLVNQDYVPTPQGDGTVAVLSPASEKPLDKT